MSEELSASRDLAVSITRAASKQTYFTIRYLVDRDRVSDAFRAYAYFRWVDDCLDQGSAEDLDRKAFVERQRRLIDRCYRGEWPSDATPEERLLTDLIRSDGEEASGLRSYIQNMMNVMAIDAERRGRLLTEEQLADYTRCLAVAVTEALHYFIGHDRAAPRSEARYYAATAAHITHMLRDTLEDTAVGYFNIPRERLEASPGLPPDVASNAYRTWVRDRVRLARRYFYVGRTNFRHVANLRCRIAGYAYIARSEWVLDAIEREAFRLRADYPDRRSLKAGLRLTWLAIVQAVHGRPGRNAVPAS